MFQEIEGHFCLKLIIELHIVLSWNVKKCQMKGTVMEVLI